MDAWKLTSEETPPATGSKVPVWMENERGGVIPGTYEESLCDAGEDAQGYWKDEEGREVREPVRWMPIREHQK